jgi:SAM-dependent methyltransferase
MAYADALNPDLLCRIPSGARMILDIGCGAGALGAEYKRRNPTATVIGIEVDPASAAIAKQRLDRVYVADLDTDPTPFSKDIEKGAVDCLVYGDILEHIRDPWSLLRRNLEYLSDTGSIVLCIPNVDHWSFVERLLKGTWSYEDQGLFDVTHLRWFTADSVRTMLRSVGLTPLDMAPRTFDVPSCEAFVDTLTPALRNVGIDPEAYRQRAAPIQHVWRARRQPLATQLTLVSTMLSPIGGVSEVRVIEPRQALQADPSVLTKVVANTDDPPLDVEGPRIFIFHRPLLAGDAGLERVKVLLDRGWVVVCEFDDHPDYIPVLQRPDIHNFRAVHAVQTTTKPLASVLYQYNPEIVVFENAISRLPDIENFTQNNRMSLLFAGLNREGEWPQYVSSLNSVSKRVGERLHFEIINDRALFDALETENKSFTPLCDYETYRNILAKCEISFMPLSDTPFNRCKSDLKFIEAAACRVTALASAVVYGDRIEDGRTGVIFRTPDELEQRLSRLVANPEVARAIGDAGRQYIRDNRMLAYQLPQRAAWYQSLWERREELNRSLLARVPQLAG